jgi:hypothetical protein
LSGQAKEDFKRGWDEAKADSESDSPEMVFEGSEPEWFVRGYMEFRNPLWSRGDAPYYHRALLREGTY